VDSELVESVTTVLDRLAQRRPRPDFVEVVIEASAPAHVGLGSKTTTGLAALMAVNVECDLGLTRSDLVALSARGGTSGIGVHTFFEGGLIVDAGRRDDSSAVFEPSSASPTGGNPTVLARHRMPEDWRVSLLLPRGIRRSADAEVEFFRANTPIDVGAARSAVAFGAFVIPAAVLEGDLDQFAFALRTLQRVGFKAREIQGQSPGVAEVLLRLESLDSVAAGMSSMGPLVFAIWDATDESSFRSIRSIAAETSSEIVATTSFANDGYVVSS
jgi:beta-ribofuranosylaminobenzene 5'-phosphate synthase